MDKFIRFGYCEEFPWSMDSFSLGLLNTFASFIINYGKVSICSSLEIFVQRVLFFVCAVVGSHI